MQQDNSRVPASTEINSNMVSILATPTTRLEITAAVVDYARHRIPIHAIRTDVFVHEQQIPLDFEIDSLDWESQHVLAFHGDQPVGTGRLAPTGKIGRVAVSRPLRRQGVGVCIMRHLLELAAQNGHCEVFLSAQCHAAEFYEKLGFHAEGDTFLEVGIVHVTMRKQLVRI
ncbi:MAG: GNAT family N-acetyltransferase [Cyanobacteria bacterium P01_D01_bin.71]